MTESRPPRLTALARLSLGVTLVVLAVLLFGLSRLVSAGQRHSYDRGATPAPTYHLTRGEKYQLSVHGGIAELRKKGLLPVGSSPQCRYSSAGGPDETITLDSVKDDERDLQVFATFTSPVSGDVHVSCVGMADVFVDDADDAGFDYSALLVVLATLVGVAGVGVAASGGYGLERHALSSASASASASAAAASSASAAAASSASAAAASSATASDAVSDAASDAASASSDGGAG